MVFNMKIMVQKFVFIVRDDNLITAKSPMAFGKDIKRF